jgi:RNA polymerase sigma-70 factor (ECF subfamily)
MAIPAPEAQPGAAAYPELLDRARHRDPEAISRLYNATRGRVFGYLLARIGETSAAEDLLQDVYLAGLEGIPRFRGRSEAEFVAWILQIARSKFADRLRYRYRHPETIPGAVDTQTPEDPMIAINQRDQAREIGSALDRLTSEQRDVVMMRLVMDLDLEKTASLLHKSVGSVKAIQHRALTRLAAMLREELR